MSSFLRSYGDLYGSFIGVAVGHSVAAIRTLVMIGAIQYKRHTAVIL